MPIHAVERAGEALNSPRRPLNGSRVLFLGFAYKQNVGDERESPSYRIMELLKQLGGCQLLRSVRAGDSPDTRALTMGWDKVHPLDRDQVLFSLGVRDARFKPSCCDRCLQCLGVGVGDGVDSGPKALVEPSCKGCNLPTLIN